MNNPRLYPWPLFEILLPVWVYNAAVSVAFAKNTSIREVVERLYRGAVKRKEGKIGVPGECYSIKQGLLLSPEEIESFRQRLCYPTCTSVPLAMGWTIGIDLLDHKTPDHQDMQWVVLDMAFMRPIT